MATLLDVSAVAGHHAMPAALSSCFNFYSAQYWKGKMISRLNEILLF